MQTRLLVDGVDQGGFLALLREKSGRHVELQALCDLVLQLELGSQNIRGGPCLGEDEAVFGICVFCLDIAVDGRGLGVANTSNLESDIGRGPGANFERGSENGEILAEQVVGALPEILQRDMRVETGGNSDDQDEPSSLGGQLEAKTFFRWDGFGGRVTRSLFGF